MSAPPTDMDEPDEPAERDAPDERAAPAGAPGRPLQQALRRPVVLGALAVVVVGLLITWSLLPSGRPDPPPGSWTLVPHSGLGAWVDVYDWTTELGGQEPPVGVDDVDAMADAGVQTLYLQTGHRRFADDVIEPDRLDELIDRAHSSGMHVVAWYLPTFVDVDRDLRRLVAASNLRVDGLAVDIESTDHPDPVERNGRLVDLSNRLREEVGGDRPLAAITLSSVHVQVVNPDFWPSYPWSEIAGTYDVIMPMAYWSIRTGELRDGARYVGENIDRIRAQLDGADIPIHPIGGIADGVTAEDLDGMVEAAVDRGAIGGGIYDWNTSSPWQWEALQPLRELRIEP